MVEQRRVLACFWAFSPYDFLHWLELKEAGTFRICSSLEKG